jgi:succinate dehydrogenase / fumarate reductase cytochrome b subunit
MQNSKTFLLKWLEILLAYKKHAGSWAWILHRITGLGLTFYILLHIVALTGLVRGEAAFNEEMALFSTPIFLVLEWALCALVMFHGANGVRIVLIDFGSGARNHKKILVSIYMFSIIMILGLAYLIFAPHLLCN